MRTTWILALLLTAASATFAEDIKVELEGGGLNGSFLVTTNETSCGRLNWDGVPDKSGAMSGGQYEITVQLVADSVVLTERTRASDKGVTTDMTAKIAVPMARLPWQGRLSQTTATVFRAQSREAKRPNEASRAIGGNALSLPISKDMPACCPIHGVALLKGQGKLSHGMTVSWTKEVHDAMAKYPYVRHDTWDSQSIQYCKACEAEVDKARDAGRR